MAEKDFSVLPKVVTLKNTSETQVTSFSYFRINFIEVLQPGDSIKITTTTSEELAFYVALNDEAACLEVTFA